MNILRGDSAKGFYSLTFSEDSRRNLSFINIAWHDTDDATQPRPEDRVGIQRINPYQQVVHFPEVLHADETRFPQSFFKNCRTDRLSQTMTILGDSAMVRGSHSRQNDPYHAEELVRAL